MRNTIVVLACLLAFAAVGGFITWLSSGDAGRGPLLGTFGIHWLTEAAITFGLVVLLAGAIAFLFRE